MEMFWTASVAVVLFLQFDGAWCCGGHERDSLVHFKASVLDPSKQVLNSWHGFNCCEWSGIQCHPLTHHVIRLDLHSSMDAHYGYDLTRPLSNLNGDVLTPLFNLEHLEHLDLSWSNFSGVSIPHGLARLKSLRYLDLSSSGFSGDIPGEVGNMSSLHYLDLSSSVLRIVGMQSWTGNLRYVQELILGEVEMSRVGGTELDNALSTMYSLTRLQMSACNLSVAIPPSLANLTNLTHLDLSSNKLNGSIPSALLSLPRLQQVDLSSNYDLEGNLSRILPQHSASLHTLVLYKTAVGGSIPDSVPNISSLTVLDLTHCRVESIPITMANHTELKELYLSSNILRGHIPPFGDRYRPLGRSFPLAHIQLSHNQLDGPIPPMLFAAFPNLQIVDLSYNQLTGSIPPPAGKLCYLTELYLSSNALTGKIPASLGSLSSLVSLDFSNNKLSDKVPTSIGQLLSIKNLDLSNNKLEGAIPLNISNLSNLNLLHLSGNRLTGIFSESHIDYLSQLQMVDISGNLLTVNFSPTWIPKFNLGLLVFSSCNMEGGFPTFLITQYEVSAVDLFNCSLAGDIPQWIWGLNSLKYLNLSHNHFAGVLPHSLVGNHLESLDLHSNNLQGQLPLLPHSLRLLDVSENQLSGSIPAKFGEYYNLQFLSLSRNNFNGSIPPPILCRALIVDLSNNNLTGKIPGSSKNPCSIKISNLENNYLKGDQLPEQLIASMPSLQMLKLGGNGLNSYIPSSLANCKELEILDLNNNKMKGNIPKWIGQLSSLKVLILRSNRFGGIIPSEVTMLPLLQILDLSSNRFSGVIPANISYIQALKNKTVGAEIFGAFRNGTNDPLYIDRATIIRKGHEMEFVRSLALVKCIDFSNNNLTGEIPQNIGLLEGLIILNISRNHITGEIPVSLGKMAQLESLDLSQNWLSGNIPVNLQLLTFLSYLDVSYNNLSGKIPQGGQFYTFEASSFSNNSDLCGLQLNKTCCCLHQCHSCPPSTNVDLMDKEEEKKDVWWGVSVGMSYAVGFSIVIGVLCLTTTWSRKCFQVMDSIIIYLFERFRK